MIDCHSQKHLISKKISLESKSPLSSTLDNFFSNPINYFNDDLGNQKIVFDKKSLSNKSNINYVKLKPEDIKNFFRDIKNKERIYRTNFLKSKFYVNRSNSALTIRDNVITKETDNKELDMIYSYFYKKKKNTSKSPLNLFEDYSHTIQKNINQVLNLQSKILKHKTKVNSENDLIIQHVSKKIKMPQEELLMNKIGFFRLKQQVKNDVYKEMKLKDPLPSFKWPCTLRNKENRYSSSYMNTGTIENPKWQLVIERNGEHHEKIYNSNSVNESEMKALKTYLDNSYLQNRISKRSLNKVRINLNKNIIMKEIAIKGKDLLKFEREISNSLKRKKYILQIRNEPEKINQVLFSKKVQYMKMAHHQKDKQE